MTAVIAISCASRLAERLTSSRGSSETLEQLSGSLSRQSVPSMGEPRCCIVRGNRLDSEANCFLERLLGAGSQSTQDGFALGERLLDGCEVGRGGRQEEQLAVAGFNGLANAVGFVSAQIV